MLKNFFDLSAELPDISLVLTMFVWMIVAWCLEFKLIHSTNSKVRTLCGGGLAVLFVPMILVVYRLFCQGAETVQECFDRGFAAILVMSIDFLVSAAMIVYMVRKDRNISEEERMKLKDL